LDAATCSRSLLTPETDAAKRILPTIGKGVEYWVNAKISERIEWQRDEAYAAIREMIELNETTGDPDPAITERARALLPENANMETPNQKERQ
jgi:hypothetical protein